MGVAYEAEEFLNEAMHFKAFVFLRNHSEKLVLANGRINKNRHIISKIQNA